MRQGTRDRVQAGPEGHSKDFGFCLSELGASQGSEPGVWGGERVSDLGVSGFVPAAAPRRLQGRGRKQGGLL